MKVGHETRQAGSRVAHEAVGQGKQVVAETRQQARNLVGEATKQIRTQAEEQQRRTADGLRSLGSQLESMADAGGQNGVAGDVARHGANVAQQTAGWLERQEPGALVQEVREYARRHPGGFLAGAALVGLLVGRLTRGVASADGDTPEAQPGPDRGGTGSRPQGPPEPTGRRPQGPTSATGLPPLGTGSTPPLGNLNAGEGMIR